MKKIYRLYQENVGRDLTDVECDRIRDTLHTYGVELEVVYGTQGSPTHTGLDDDEIMVLDRYVDFVISR